jgi:hypothetical protein
MKIIFNYSESLPFRISDLRYRILKAGETANPKSYMPARLRRSGGRNPKFIRPPAFDTLLCMAVPGIFPSFFGW